MMQTKSNDARPRKSTGQRMALRAAATELGISKDQLLILIGRGLFTMQQDHGGGDRYVLTDEIEFWIEAIGTPEEREAALRKFRLKKKRLKEPAK